MDLSEENEQIKKEKLRVCAYVRVSSDMDRQLHSFKSQTIYYTNKIKNNPDWEFVGIYSDEGISGTSTKNRNGFLKMLLDAERGKIDLVLTKSISRFARNTLDTLKYVRKLKEDNIGVFFEEENINTLDLQSELILTIISSVAEQESYNMSEHIRLGKRMRRLKGILTKNYRSFGYRWDEEKEELVIIEENAEIIRLIYDLYEKCHNMAEVARRLNDMNIRTTGKRETWSSCAVEEILIQEKNKGDIIIGKYYIDSVTNKTIKRNKGQRERILIENNHQPIIERERFDRIQEIIKQRGKELHYPEGDKKSYSAYKVRCGFCGQTMRKIRKRYQREKYEFVCRDGWLKKTDCLSSARVPEDMFKKVIDLTLKELKKLKVKDDLFIYTRKQLPYLKTGEYQKIFDSIIRCVLFGDEVDLHTIIVILKSNNILNPSISRNICTLDGYKKLHDFYCNIQFLGKDNNGATRIIDGFDVLIYVEDV